MKLKIALTINFGKDEAIDESRYVDAIGTHHNAGETDHYMGFTTGPREGDSE